MTQRSENVRQTLKNINKKRTIYLMENKSNGKRYIGISMDYERRKKGHLYSMRKGTHTNSQIQNDYDDGKSDFVFTKLKEVDGLLESLKEESRLIEEYDTIRNGYNVIENARPII